MKLIKKIAAIMLSIMIVLGMASVVSASEADSTAVAGNGKITITNAIAGQTYKIYKLLELESYDKDKNLYSYKPASAKWENFFKTGEGSSYVDINENGYVTWKADVSTDKAAELAQKALAYAAENSITAADTKNATNNTVVFDNLALGYYLVESSVGALCGLTTTNNEVIIQEKNGVPSVEKKVQEDSKVGKTDEWGDGNTADIGQTVNFQTTITAQPGAQNYVLHDKMNEGLTFDISSVKVKLKKNNATTEDIVDTSKYEVKNSGLEDSNPCTFHVVFTQEFCNSLAAGDQIIVTYSATLNEKAVIAGDGNTNETWLKYGENSETTHDTTTTKTFELPVFKYTMKNNAETALADAIFTLSKNANGSDPIELVRVSEDDTTGDIYRVAKENEATGTIKTTEITTTKSGKFTIKGLDADTYYLTETQQPDGYNKLSAPITVVITEEGNITVDTQTVNEVKVENKTGSLLPSTGGSGTTLIYILGAILVLGSSVVLITKKRMR